VADEAAVHGGLVVVAHGDQALVQLGALVVARLSLLGDRRADARGVPRTEVADPSAPPLSGVLALALLDAPALDGTLRPLALRDAVDVHVLARAEDVRHRVFAALGEEVQRELQSLVDRAPADAGLHDVGALLRDVREVRGDRVGDGAQVGHLAGGDQLAQVLCVTLERLRRRQVDDPVEFLVELVGPDLRRRLQSVRRVSVGSQADRAHRRRLDDGDRH
jgi:hypothetical protein